MKTWWMLAAGFWVGCGMTLAQGPSRVDKRAPIVVPEAAGATDVATRYEDKRYRVRFTVPPGWQLTRKDGEVSTFHMDARSAAAANQLRGVAILNFNPFPTTTLSGALVYFSVEPKATDIDCAKQAYGSGPKPGAKKDVREIGGVPFTHGHDEHGGLCTEARDEIYTAYHRHACYRFDLSINTFCGIYSGAQDISEAQLDKVRERMTGILSTVTFDW